MPHTVQCTSVRRRNKKAHRRHPFPSNDKTFCRTNQRLISSTAGGRQAWMHCSFGFLFTFVLSCQLSFWFIYFLLDLSTFFLIYQFYLLIFHFTLSVLTFSQRRGDEMVILLYFNLSLDNSYPWSALINYIKHHFLLDNRYYILPCLFAALCDLIALYL